jgi:uncharacterized protein
MATRKKKARILSDVAGLFLTPGAGTSAEHPSLLAIEEHMRAELPDFAVTRMDFPYRNAGRRAPDRAPVLIASVNEGVQAFADELGVPTDRIVIGGRSMGGRMCSMAIAEGLDVAGLISICYPLHPPGKPESLRITHLPAINVPCLFLSGTKDAFGTPDEFAQHLPSIPGPRTEVWLEGKGHDLKGCNAVIAEHIRDWISTT